ncbi:hypothetical protein RV134_50002 [Roseovarius sp. EC-HK134]|nr:hypothetical protein RV420_10020 [Roseovarius sp. EC-SD190]VVT34072.1 hypothetical protein RV134_50002 [Roseovarius sp. EC-HK134]
MADLVARFHLEAQDLSRNLESDVYGAGWRDPPGNGAATRDGATCCSGHFYCDLPVVFSPLAGFGRRLWRVSRCLGPDIGPERRKHRQNQQRRRRDHGNRCDPFPALLHSIRVHRSGSLIFR